MTKKEHEKELRSYPAALTATEVAEILRVSTKTVYKLIKEKCIADRLNPCKNQHR